MTLTNPITHRRQSEQQRRGRIGILLINYGRFLKRVGGTCTDPHEKVPETLKYHDIHPKDDACDVKYSKKIFVGFSLDTAAHISVSGLAQAGAYCKKHKL